MTATTVAQLYPARRQPDGGVWYLAAGKDGWTANLALAHPDYRAEGAPEPLSAPLSDESPSAGVSAAETITTTTEETTMTALTEDFAPAPRFTEWMHYPLPPETPRPRSKFGAWGWYQLPSPSTGRPTGFPRATTIAETLDETYGLNRWKRRETAIRIFQLAQMDPKEQLSPHFDTTAADAMAALVASMEGDKVGGIDATLDTIDNLMGGSDARELGECVHAWLEALDMGMVLLRDVPEVVMPHITAARKVMAHRGIVSIPEYVERTILNDQGDETVAGKIDRIFRIVTTGELVLGDIKTSKSLQYSWLSFGVQVGGVYGWATKVLSLDGKSWLPMPELRDDFAILLHVPSDQPEHAAAITIDLQWGAEVMVESLATRSRRKEAKNEVPKHAIPTPSKEAIRYAEARLALSEITTLDEGTEVFEAYQDVWDDDLGEFATTVAELVD